MDTVGGLVAGLGVPMLAHSPRLSGNDWFFCITMPTADIPSNVIAADDPSAVIRKIETINYQEGLS